MPRRDAAAPSSPPAPPSPRRAFAAALALSLGGLVIAGMLVRVHVNAHAGLTSFCDLGEHMSCDTVALSPYSIVLGLPIAVWGVLGYLAFTALSVMGLLSRKPHPTWPAGLLFLLSAASLAGAVVLAYVSEFVIHSFCIMCAASWTVTLALLVVSVLACRGAGLANAVASDLGVLGARPAFAVGGVVVLLALAGVARAAYPRYWEKPPKPATAVRPAMAPVAPGQKPPAPGAETVVVEYSDFECPFCAIAHEQMKGVMALKPGLRVVQRHFPLSSECNPALNRVMHEKACEYARAAICAESMGKGDEMEDALFGLQKQKEPLDAVVKRLGLDPARFGACLASPQTKDRLASDVAEGQRVGIRATPTFFFNGKAYPGKIPDELLQ
ncbi:MAG: vitamin K epoxide reductase family protein [Anaeromyxobacter sp.]